MRSRLVSVLPLPFLSLALAPPATAQMQPNAREGERLARHWCASCHLVAPDQRPAPDTAPPFAALAARPGMSEVALRTMVQMPYPRMPQIALSRDEVAHIVAYILTLKAR
jgi:mono/diheme cytochrome c family protein